MEKDPLLPDLAVPPSAVRKRRVTKHDFKDGFGPVPARRHENGGGWVANTAYVAATATVTRNAEVFGFAKVYDNCKINGKSRVYDHATLHHAAVLVTNARVFGWSSVRNNSRIGQDSVVMGAAIVRGSSNLSGRVVVSDQAIVDSSRISGGRAADTRICGAATVRGATCYGVCEIDGHALVDSSTLSHTFVTGTAVVQNSTICTDIAITNGQIFRWLLSDGSEPAPGSLESVVSYIYGTVINSYYAGSALRLSVFALIANCTLSTRHSARPLEQNNYFVLLRAHQALVGLSRESMAAEELMRLAFDSRNMPAGATAVAAQAQIAVSGQPVIPARGTAPEPGSTRQRRLLRLGE
jgi:carbonic anhydrase/acetyltransferase-like protein (isoleucine patch superfamily)